MVNEKPGPSCKLRIIRSTFLVVVAVALNPFLFDCDVQAEIVSFDTSSRDHGSGSQIGWNDGEFSGTTTVLGNNTLTITTSAITTAAYTANHFHRINQSYFTGFAFQLDPETSGNYVNSLVNFNRVDFSFSSGVNLDSFTLTDVDRTNNRWSDVFVGEGFTTSTPGAVGTGISADYAFQPVNNLTTMTTRRQLRRLEFEVTSLKFHLVPCRNPLH